jgi:hypothetical protein
MQAWLAWFSKMRVFLLFLFYYYIYLLTQGIIYD